MPAFDFAVLFIVIVCFVAFLELICTILFGEEAENFKKFKGGLYKSFLALCILAVGYGWFIGKLLPYWSFSFIALICVFGLFYFIDKDLERG